MDPSESASAGRASHSVATTNRTADHNASSTVSQFMKHCRLFLNTLVVAAVVFISAGCGSSDEARGDRTPRRVRALDQVDPSFSPAIGVDVPEVGTVQLFADGSETNPPIIPLRSSAKLTLAFDLLAEQSRPLSVHFYHADQSWRRDLSPSEYLGTYHRDNIRNQFMSQATEARFVHYRYQFPNEAISFLISGNYIVRVSEQGNEDDVLFERAFYVTEESIPVDLILGNVFVPRSSFPAIQPTAVFTPPADAQANVFNYTVCFARDGQLGATRCTDNPSLMNQPALEFYLQPSAAFRSAGSDYLLDLSILQPGNQIERLDVTTSPHTVRLAPDYVRFGADDLAPRLMGQAVVDGAVRDVGDPQTQAEYVATTFSLVTEGDRRLAGDVYVVGAFNGWQRTPRGRMTWNSETGRYEVTMMIKQGRYEYRYVSPTAATNTALSQSLPRQGGLYTAFVYFDDIRLQTDRLVGVGQRRDF